MHSVEYHHSCLHSDSTKDERPDDLAFLSSDPGRVVIFALKSKMIVTKTNTLASCLMKAMVEVIGCISSPTLGFQL